MYKIRYEIRDTNQQNNDICTGSTMLHIIYNIQQTDELSRVHMSYDILIK